MAELTWNIPKGKYSAVDTFNLDLPCVFKFTSRSQSLPLRTRGTDFAACNLANGELAMPFSSVQCIVLGTTSDVDATGTLVLPFVFNTGDGGTYAYLTCASKFQQGINTITWSDGHNDLKSSVYFKGGSPNEQSSLSSGFFNLRSLPSVGKWESTFMVADACEAGFSKITFGIVATDGAEIDCANARVGIVND